MPILKIGNVRVRRDLIGDTVMIKVSVQLMSVLNI
ncbi:hypothetical protein J2S02_003608 [Metabacillus niabensis]|uniref:Single-stranded DNA-binding protein n=1 Tax=Metabacillus niabensis TaxID=324854 RepID=A0ABT9Z4R8_9BACI|nr:hypothetical protein [Metabacillus niabensis]